MTDNEIIPCIPFLKNNTNLKILPPKSLEQPNFIQKNLQGNFEESKDSNSLNISINEKSFEMKENTNSQKRKKIAKNSRKSLSICVSNIREPLIKTSFANKNNDNLFLNDQGNFKTSNNDDNNNNNNNIQNNLNLEQEHLNLKPSPILLPARSEYYLFYYYFYFY